MSTEQTVSRNTLYQGKILKLHVDQVKLESGKLTTREVVEHGGGVAILAVEEGNLLLVRQHRYAAGKELLELPAGKLEPGEDPAVCAVRELEEETGRRAGGVRELGRFYASPGYCSELLYLYAARDLTVTAQHLDEDEELSVVRLPVQEAVDACRDGRIIDAKTALAICLWQQEQQSRG